MRSKQRHPVQRAVDQSDEGWGSVPEVLLQAYPPKSTAEWERGLGPVSRFQAGEEGQQEPLQEETLDLKAAGDLDSQAGLTHKLEASHCAAFGQPSAGCYGAPSAIPILHKVFTASTSSLVAAAPRRARLWAQGYGNFQHETSSSNFSFVLSPNYHVQRPT